jgi:hypothetical protein
LKIHPIYLGYLQDGIHGYLLYSTCQWEEISFHKRNVSNVFDPTGRYELHLKDRMFMHEGESGEVYWVYNNKIGITHNHKP